MANKNKDQDNDATGVIEMIHHIENLLRDLRITMKYLIKSTKGSEALNVRLESLKKDLEAIGKMFNESMKEYFEKKNGVIILNLVNLSIYENSNVSFIFIFIVKCRLSNKEIHLLCYLYDLFMFIVKSCLSNKEFQCKSVVKIL